jgi:hypothetical protein
MPAVFNGNSNCKTVISISNGASYTEKKIDDFFEKRIIESIP